MKKSNIFIGEIILFFCLSVLSMFLANKFVQSDIQKIIFYFCAVIFFIIECFAVYQGVTNYVNENKELQIAEKDERNVLIRGKASEISFMISIMMQTVIFLIFTVVGLNIAAIIMIILVSFELILHISFIGYYQKRF